MHGQKGAEDQREQTERDQREHRESTERAQRERERDRQKEDPRYLSLVTFCVPVCARVSLYVCIGWLRETELPQEGTRGTELHVSTDRQQLRAPV